MQTAIYSYVTKLSITVLFISIWLKSIGQVTVIQNGDPRYQNSVLDENGATTTLWELKSDLQKGKYWVIDSSVCGIDTLELAEFSDMGIRHETWIEWEPRLCFGSFNDISEEIENWAFISEREKRLETVYDSGFIIKSIVHYVGSNQANWVLFYPEKVTEPNDWTEEHIFREDGTLRWITKVNVDGSAFHQSFYPGGQLKNSGTFGKDGSFKGIWKYYYQNGQLMGQGAHEPPKTKGIRLYAGWRTPKGYWQYWDEEGNLIAEVTFKKGKARKVIRHLKIDIPYTEIHELK